MMAVIISLPNNTVHYVNESNGFKICFLVFSVIYFFLAHGRMALAPLEMEKVWVEFWRKIKISVWGMLCLRYLLNLQKCAP